MDKDKETSLADSIKSASGIKDRETQGTDKAANYLVNDAQYLLFGGEQMDADKENAWGMRMATAMVVFFFWYCVTAAAGMAVPAVAAGVVGMSIYDFAAQLQARHMQRLRLLLLSLTFGGILTRTVLVLIYLASLLVG